MKSLLRGLYFSSICLVFFLPDRCLANPVSLNQLLQSGNIKVFQVIVKDQKVMIQSLLSNESVHEAHGEQFSKVTQKFIQSVSTHQFTSNGRQGFPQAGTPLVPASDPAQFLEMNTETLSGLDSKIAAIRYPSILYISISENTLLDFSQFDVPVQFVNGVGIYTGRTIVTKFDLTTLSYPFSKRLSLFIKRYSYLLDHFNDYLSKASFKNDSLAFERDQNRLVNRLLRLDSPPSTCSSLQNSQDESKILEESCENK